MRNHMTHLYVSDVAKAELLYRPEQIVSVNNDWHTFSTCLKPYFAADDGIFDFALEFPAVIGAVPAL